MTMPTLIGNYQKQKTVTQLKKAYSELSQVINLSTLDNGPISDWEFPPAFDGAATADFVNKYLVPYMNVVKNCGAESGCLSGDFYSLTGTRTFASGENDDKSAKFNVNSGYTVTVISGGYYANIAVAFNNKKDKLIMGKDVFYFQIGRDWRHESLVPHGYYNNDEHMPRTRDEIIRQELYGCSNEGDNGNQKGMNCSALIMADGWQIAPDYPW